MKTKTYEHIIKRINKCTDLSNDDCRVEQTQNKNLPPLPHPPPPLSPQKKKKNRTQKKKTKNKTKETRTPILITKMNKVFLQAT